jgi:hypothetical protein
MKALAWSRRGFLEGLVALALAGLASGCATKAVEEKQGEVVRQKLAESQREIEAAIRLADQAQFATFQGYLHAVQGRKGEARSAFNRAVGLYPGTSLPSGRWPESATSGKGGDSPATRVER